MGPTALLPLRRKVCWVVSCYTNCAIPFYCLLYVVYILSDVCIYHIIECCSEITLLSCLFCCCCWSDWSWKWKTQYDGVRHLTKMEIPARRVTPGSSAGQMAACPYILGQRYLMCTNSRYRYIFLMSPVDISEVTCGKINCILWPFMRAVRKVSSHFDYLENLLCGLDITLQPVRGDLTVQPWTFTLPWG